MLFKKQLAKRVLAGAEQVAVRYDMLMPSPKTVRQRRQSSAFR